ncbi:MAG TPA: hypothetical protein DGH14_13335 [Roseburia sp.]|nr:hypothetical protein [Roseburia sp.]
MKSLESFSENVIGFRMVHAIIGHRVSTLWPILLWRQPLIRAEFTELISSLFPWIQRRTDMDRNTNIHRRKAYEV